MRQTHVMTGSIGPVMIIIGSAFGIAFSCHGPSMTVSGHRYYPRARPVRAGIFWLSEGLR